MKKKLRTLVIALTALLASGVLTGCGLFGKTTQSSPSITQDFNGCTLSWDGPEEIKFYNISCIGYKSSQTIEYTIAVNNSMANRYIRFYGHEAFDQEGNTYEVLFKNKNGYAPLSVSGDTFLPTGQDVVFTIIVKGCLPSMDKISTLRLEWGVTKPDHIVHESSGDLLLRNIPIYWKN